MTRFFLQNFYDTTFVRSFGNPGCCGWDTYAPFHLGNTPSRCTPVVVGPDFGP